MTGRRRERIGKVGRSDVVSGRESKNKAKLDSKAIPLQLSFPSRTRIFKMPVELVDSGPVQHLHRLQIQPSC